MYEYAINQFINGVLNQVQNDLNNLWSKATKKTLIEIQDIVRQSIKESPEYNILILDSRAFHEIGIDNIDDRMDGVIELVVKDIELDSNIQSISKVKNTVKAEFQIRILDLDYEELLKSPEASFITKKGDSLDWLKWLLLEGTSSVILNYRYLDKVGTWSRTGQGIMIPNAQPNLWSVPSELSGTRENNWLVRAITKLDVLLPNIINKNFAGV